MLIPRVLIFDDDDYTAAVLQDVLARRGFVAPIVSDGAMLMPQISRERPDILVFNFHYGRNGPLDCVARLHRSAARPAILALAAPGTPLRGLRDWMARTGAIDAVIEKPLADGALDDALRQLAAVACGREHAGSYRPDAIGENVCSGDNGTRARLTERAILVTDLRPTHAAGIEPGQSFDRINLALARQSQLVRRHQGSVVDTTAHGMVCAFAGAGRAHFALRCALDLQQEIKEHRLDAGIGVCSGVVLDGLLQSASGARYTVAGAAAALASRLAVSASGGQLLTDADTLAAAHLAESGVTATAVPLPGFNTEILSLQPPTAASNTAPLAATSHRETI